MPFYYQYIASSLPFSNPGLFTEDPMVGALRTQSTACEALGSYMYRDLFTALADDYEDGGRTYAILAGRSDRPVHDAIPLRLAGAIHKVVLEGLEPRLARHYPSMGGSPGEDFTADFIGYMKDHIDDIEMGLGRQVQTNEVGRSVVHLVLSHWLTTLDITEFDFLEVGASAGLNLNFDKFYACFGQLRMGSQQSPLRFMGDWFGNAPDVPRIGATVRRRRGTDISPIDVRNHEDATRLLSFIWPDQKRDSNEHNLLSTLHRRTLRQWITLRRTHGFRNSSNGNAIVRLLYFIRSCGNTSAKKCSNASKKACLSSVNPQRRKRHSFGRAWNLRGQLPMCASRYGREKRNRLSTD